MKTKRILTGYLIASVLIGIGLAVWRTVLLYKYFDPYNDRFPFSANDSLDAFGYVMAGLILLSLTAFIFLYKKEFQMSSVSAHQFSIFASSLCSCLFAASGVLSLIYYANELFSAVGTPFYRVTLLLSLFSLFLASPYFLLAASSRFEEHPAKKLFAFFPAVFAVSYLMASYLSPDFLFSDSNDILRNVSLAALTFFFIYEMRMNFYGKNSSSRFVFSLVAIIALIAYFIPNLITTAFWEMELSFTTMFELAECGAIVYAIASARAMIKGLSRKEESSAAV